MDIVEFLTNQSVALSLGIYFFIFLIALFESFPMFGFIVPGQIVAVTAGLLAKVGSLDIFIVIIILFFGAIIGDLIGYFLGEKYGESLIARYGKYFFIKKENFVKTCQLINEHPGKTIVIGRFNSITRAFAPFAAGSAKIPLNQFIFFNFFGGLSWALSFSLLGYILGENYKTIANYFGEFVIIAMIIGGIIIYLYKKANKKRRIFHRRHLYILLINLFSLYIFFKMIENFVDRSMLIQWDSWISQHIPILWNDYLNNLMVFITTLGDNLSILILSLLLLVFFIFKKKWRYSVLLVASILGGKALGYTTKIIIARQRPLEPIIFTDGYSLPSGHALMSIILFSILAYYFKNHIKNKNFKYFLMTTSFFLILGIGFSRIYLNAHWFTDVIAGFSLGLFWVTLLILALEAITTIFKEKVAEIKKVLNKEK